MQNSSPVTQLDIGRSMTWMFKSPNWMSNLFWMVLCSLLGTVVIGTLVAYGYQVDIVQRRSRGRDDVVPDFDPNRFVDYLTRGAWPFLVYMILGGIISIAMVVLIVLTTLICTLPFQGEGEPPPLAIAAMVGGIGVWTVFFMAALMVVMPLCLRAGLMNSFTEGFKIAWGVDFFRRMWPTLILTLIITIALALLAEVVGILLCFVGLFFTMSWLQFVLADLATQLYDIFLSKGGEPVPFPDDIVDAQII